MEEKINQPTEKQNNSSQESSSEQPKVFRICLDDQEINQEEAETLGKTTANQSNQQTKELSNEAVTDFTAGLWKYYPIPKDEPEPAPEYLNYTVQYPASKVIAARVRGKKHKHEGTNCDDWFATAQHQGITFVTVSDGAGSKKFSRVGAKISCQAAIGYLMKTFENLLIKEPDINNALTEDLSSEKCMAACSRVATIVQNAVLVARQAVESAFYLRALDERYEKVLKRALNLNDLSGTFLIAVVIPISNETREQLVISCQVGDGMIALLNSKASFDKSVKLMGEPDSGDFSGETDFLTSPLMRNQDALKKRTKISRGIYDTLFVMSDGVADDYFPNEREMHRLYLDLIANGIIGEDLKPTDFSYEQMRLFKKLPDPLRYPWVNDQSIQIAIQYTRRICETLGISLEELWHDQTLINLARLEMSEMSKIDDCSGRLAVWLDNYVERGSFDDRTLVIVQM